MTVEMTFTRGKECCHSGARECTACFKAAMSEVLGTKRFAEDWARRSAQGPEDGVEAFSTYHRVLVRGEP